MSEASLTLYFLGGFFSIQKTHFENAVKKKFSCFTQCEIRKEAITVKVLFVGIIKMFSEKEVHADSVSIL